MMQVEAVMQMLQPGLSVAGNAAKRRNKSNPYFKRGTLFRSAVDVMQRAGTPMTARDIADKLVDLQQVLYAALRKRDGGMVVGEGAPARWRLKEAATSNVGCALRVMC
jgi:hypothetical protein